ncbi:Asp23/Gls24 family envelope stress response protein [Corynebacterium accolens]|uniref:Asp23/Gls24 family envelope stress response protein n=1 Tax=Corynebacterium accolens TaxID=38284 RepID=UPI0025428A77|nr:Asp23/Gls24 family envelope stress response protein [Corynebacterium accolens]MDK4279272.1 Asp23/Gls24 family envelope stress response protein [Corynebacterium accolens]MDK8820975.1 Asp23/Gls24 family envelope stress response protein [Corynebacterium accolens]
MSENNTPTKHSENNVAASEEREVNNNLETQYGTTTIDDVVVSKIAGIAAREVSGVDSLGGGGARMMGTIRESFGASEDVRQGVDVEVENGSAKIEIAITAEYGVAIHELAEAIRRNIMNAVERMTGLTVERVDVVVHNVKLPKEDSESEEQAALNQGQA